MNITKLILSVAAIAAVVLGCNQGSILDSDFTKADAYLDLGIDAIEVEPASFHADSSVTEIIKITSSRSWSMATTDEVAWMDMSRTDGINLGKVVKEWPVTLAFEDNASDERETTLKVTVEDHAVELPVRQKKFEPVLTLESPSSYQLTEDGDTVKINIRCNCNWTAVLSGTAKATLDKNGGYKSETLQCIVKANLDTSSGKEASIVLSADGAENITVNITQDVCIPRLEIDAELSETDVLPKSGDSKLVFDVNETWTASLEEGASAGVSLSATSGEPGDELFVCFPDATLETASATVVITTASGLTDRLTFTQKGCVFISFRKWPDNNGYTSIAMPLLNYETGKYDIPRDKADFPAGTYVQKDPQGRKYTLWTGQTEGESMYHSEACGLTLGSIVDNPAFYIEFPAIEGKRLSEVKVMLGNSEIGFKDGTKREATATGTRSFITDVSGNVVGGGAVQQVLTYQKDDDWNTTNTIPSFHSDYYNHTESMFHFVLTDSQPAAAYRFVGEYRQVIRWFILYYE